MPSGNTVTSATRADLLKNHLRPAIKSKRRELLSTGVLLQHDNARRHTARSTVATTKELSFECLPHPPCSPDLAPNDFHVFGPLKEAMGGKSFRSDEEVQQAVHEWLQSQPKYFFFQRYPCTSESLEQLYGTQWRLRRKLCHCVPYSRSQWPRGLRRRFSAARLLRSWVLIPPRSWMLVCCECCVLSGRGLCDD